MRVIQGNLARYIGEIFLNVADQHLAEAEDWIKKAIEADKRNNTLWSLGGDYAVYAKLYQRKGDLPKVKENLRRAIEIFKECGADGWVSKYEKEMVGFG